MHIRRILSDKGTTVATIGPEDSVTDASRLLGEHRVGALVVTGPTGVIEGLISERDLARALAVHGAATMTMRVRELMQTPVRTCAPHDTVDHLMSVMTEHRTRHLPVVDGDGAMVGLVSIGDVVKFRVGELEEESQTLHDYLVTGRS
jgi:CBS domain-containing protein